MLSIITKAFRAPLLKRVCASYQIAAGFSTSSVVVTKSAVPAVIERKPDEILIKHWWSETPFDVNKPLSIPVHNFETGEYAGENVELDHKIFNVPLRRDIVHKVYQWRIMLNRITTDVTRTKGTTAGSNKKPFQQKGTGRARQGNKRAPGRKKGGKAHGRKPMNYTFKITKKIRLHALKVMLSAKLAEGKIRIVNDEKVEAPKTKLVATVLKQFDPKYRFLVITGYKTDPNFEVAQKNIPRVELTRPDRINILKLLKCDRLVLTKQGLEDLVQNLQDRTELRYRLGTRYNREQTASEIRRAEVFNIKPKTKEMPKYDPSKPISFKFKVLEEYLKDYEKRRSGEATTEKKEN